MLRTMQDKTFEALVKLFGGDEEAAKRWLAANIDTANRAIAKSNMVTRQGKAPVIRVVYKGKQRGRPVAIGDTADLPAWRRRQLGVFVAPDPPSWLARQQEVAAAVGDLSERAAKTLRKMESAR